LEFDVAAFEDLAWWVKQDRAMALRIIHLIQDVQRDPYSGIENPSLSSTNSAAAGPDASIKNIALSTKFSKTKLEFSRAVITTDRVCSRVGGLSFSYRKIRSVFSQFPVKDVFANLPTRTRFDGRKPDFAVLCGSWMVVAVFEELGPRS
jgi:YoeB-like toxin of bacterial type II toxin-antitoxin system